MYIYISPMESSPSNRLHRLDDGGVTYYNYDNETCYDIHKYIKTKNRLLI